MLSLRDMIQGDISPLLILFVVAHTPLIFFPNNASHHVNAHSHVSPPTSFREAEAGHAAHV